MLEAILYLTIPRSFKSVLDASLIREAAISHPEGATISLLHHVDCAAGLSHGYACLQVESQKEGAATVSC